MSRVLVTRHLPEGSLAPLDASGHQALQRATDEPMGHDELVAAVADVDAVICLLTDQIDGDILRAGAKAGMRVVGNVAVGFDNVDVATAAELGIAVCNTPGVLDQTTADLAFLLILAALRRSSDAERDLREGRWAGWGISDHLGRDVHGSIVGLVGYGRIGREVARRASGFGMEVLHHTRTPTGFPGYVASLDELLATSDAVSLHVPLTEATRHLVDRRALSQMKPTAVLVNTSRGPVVDEEALAQSLERGELFGAGIDVYEREPGVHPRLLAAPNAVLLPHIGSATTQTRVRMGRLASQGVCDVLAGRTPPNLVVPR